MIPEKEMWCGCYDGYFKSEKRFLTHIKKIHPELYKSNFESLTNGD